MNLRIATTAVLATAALAAAGCGDDTDSGSAAAGGTGAATAAPAATTQTTSGTAEATAAKLKISTDLSEKPAIPKPAGAPPSRLVVQDVVEGKGPAAKAGDTLTVHYVGVSHSTGEQFDASWDSGQPFPFALGQGMVIPGWDQGLEGMKKGGRRTLIIPPDLAYGPQGSPPAIGPNETLVFVVDLKDIG
jgi:peptidylprolyl isomerase